MLGNCRGPWAIVLFVALSGCGNGAVGGSQRPRTDGGGTRDGGGLDGGANGGRDGAATVTDDGHATAPFACEPAAATPSLELHHWLHPSSPVAGQTLTVVMQSQNTRPRNGPPLSAVLVNRDGMRRTNHYTRAGGDKATYHVSIAGLAAGENCVAIYNGDNVEVAFEIIAADPGAGVARGNGVWKVSANHQWTCDEQPTWGNLLHVRVVDEAGAPVEGATVGLRFTDDAIYPVPPDDGATNFAEHGQPKTMTTGSDGRAELVTPWGEGIRSPIDAKPSYLVFQVSIEGGASDVATEISTGIWETNNDGCNFCNRSAVNVYGHWSYTVEFQRDPTATEICDVPNDHAGQGACGPIHFFHEPDQRSCIPVAP